MFQKLRLLFKEHMQISWHCGLLPCIVVIIQLVHTRSDTLFIS